MSQTATASRRPPYFTRAMAQEASNSWGFNCGPGALCGVLGMSPSQIRPSLGDFEAKGYTNPTLMAEILHRLQIPFERVFESAVEPAGQVVWPEFGLVRVQWAGPWTEPGVPIRARYRATHWIGYCRTEHQVFEINAMCIDGWMPFAEWSDLMVPWMLAQVLPKASGKWWPTHCWSIKH